MNYTSNMGMNMPDENDKFSIEHFNTNTQALDIVGKPDEYKNTKTYAVGDLCIHNNILYKCIIAVETAEEFNAEKWEVTSLCKEEIANKTAIAELNEKLQNISFGFSTNSIKTISSRTETYTVDRNCWCVGRIKGGSADPCGIILDDVLLFNLDATSYVPVVIPIKKGQKISIKGNATLCSLNFYESL